MINNKSKFKIGEMVKVAVEYYTYPYDMSEYIRVNCDEDYIKACRRVPIKATDEGVEYGTIRVVREKIGEIIGCFYDNNLCDYRYVVKFEDILQPSWVSALEEFLRPLEK